jgi:hypothetical protein
LGVEEKGTLDFIIKEWTGLSEWLKWSYSCPASKRPEFNLQYHQTNKQTKNTQQWTAIEGLITSAFLKDHAKVDFDCECKMRNKTRNRDSHMFSASQPKVGIRR